MVIAVSFQKGIGDSLCKGNCVDKGFQKIRKVAQHAWGRNSA